MKTLSALPKEARYRLSILLDMPYSVDELCQELRTCDEVVSRFALENSILEPGGWINGLLLRVCANDPRLNKSRATGHINRQNWLDTEAYLSHLERARQLDKQSIRAYRIALRRVIAWAGERPFADAPAIEPPLPAFLLEGGIEKQKLSPVTTSRTCEVARAFFRHLHANEPERYKTITPMWVETLHMGRKHSELTMLKERKVFDLVMVRRYLAIKPETLTERRDLAAIAFLYLSGMRISAFISLPAGCIDLEKLTVKQLPEKGVRTKNSKAAITSLLNIPDLLAAVRDWDQFVKAKGGPEALWYLPLTCRTQRILGDGKSESENRDQLFRRDLRKFAKKHALPYLSPHKLRHGHAVFGVKHARDMKELKAVSQNLMHSSISITDGVYGNLSYDDVNETITHLGSAPAASPAPADMAPLLQALVKLQSRPDLLQAILAAQ